MKKKTLAAALLLTLALVALAEIGARLLPLERWDPTFAGARSYPIFVRGTGPLANSYVTNDHYRKFLNFQTFALKKPPGVFRVFVLGGSAAFGWPFGEAYGFSGYLRRALESAQPGGFEVVNACGMSYGSLRMLDFLRELLDTYEPDLVILYEGNNEYVERNALPAGAADAGTLDTVRRALRSSHLYRAVRLGIFRARPRLLASQAGADLTDLRSRPVNRGRYERTPGNDELVLRNFGTNYGEMARLLQRRRVPGVFCSVPVNLAHWPPDRDDPVFPDAATAQRWSALLEETKRLLDARDAPAALARSAEALALAPGHAYTLFVRAKALQAAGDREGALAAFVAAKDRDPRTIRALAGFNAAIRGLAAPAAGIDVLDLERTFSLLSPGGVPGASLFLDYVHPDVNGHRAIAEALLPLVAERSGRPGLLPAARAALVADATRVTDPGLVAAGYYAKGMTYQQNERWAEAVAMYERALQSPTPLPEALGNLAWIFQYELQDAGRARDLLERALRIEPENGPLIKQYALLLLLAGELPQAKLNFERALAMNPLNPDALAGLGHIALAGGDPAEAARRFAAAAAQGLENADLQREWGDASRALGREDEALSHWREAVRLNPFDEEARQRLGQPAAATR